MLNELMLVQQIETMQRLHLAWIEFESRPELDGEPAAPHGLRHAVAAALVRLGIMLDRSAGDALAANVQRAGTKEIGHAL